MTFSVNNQTSKGTNVKQLNKTQLKRIERAVKLSAVSLRDKKGDVSLNSDKGNSKLTAVIWRG